MWLPDHLSQSAAVDLGHVPYMTWSRSLRDKTPEHDTLSQCWVNVGPPSATLAQHQPSIGSVPSVRCPQCMHPCIIWSRYLAVLVLMVYSMVIFNNRWPGLLSYFSFISGESWLHILLAQHYEHFTVHIIFSHLEFTIKGV